MSVPVSVPDRWSRTPAAETMDDPLSERLRRNRLTRRDAVRLFAMSVAASGAGGALQGCATSPVSGERILVGMSESMEKAVDREQAPHQFSADLGAVQDGAVNAYVGEVGIYHAAEYPEPELGWFVVPEAEGRGIAAEAARAVMVWVRGAFGWDEITNIIDGGNARSIALGLRLGGRIDASRPGIDPGDVVIVHDLRAAAGGFSMTDRGAA